jgi:nitrite reductase/ring-hydroxylating ferredoxin subunit
MSGTPAVNPNVHEMADRAKHGYATGTKLLAEAQYRLAELAGTGRLDPDESMSLQHNLVSIWEALYFGTVYAVRDRDTDESAWDEADNSYSDGRQVMIQIRIEPWETLECTWEHNRFLLGDGAVNEHPRGTICYISPFKPDDDQVVDLGDEADPADSDGEDG